MEKTNMMSDVLVKYMNNPLEDYYICYFDILGYRAYFDNSESSKHNKFLASMIIATNSIESVIRNTKTPIKINCKTYSDNFLLYAPKHSTNELEMLQLFANIMKKVQVRLLMEEGLLVRGGITIGEFYADDSIVFGEGLIRAVELEEKTAIMPRIIVDKDRFNIDISALESKQCLIEDTDGQYFVNYFYNGALQLIRGKSIRLINQNCKYHPTVKDTSKITHTERIISKYIWLLTKFNSQCKKLKLHDELIEYELKINERLSKIEISANPFNSKEF